MIGRSSFPGAAQPAARALSSHGSRQGHNPLRPAWRSPLQRTLGALSLAVLAACSSVSLKPTPAPAPPAAPAPAPAPAPIVEQSTGPSWERGKARWVLGRWAEVPGWQQDRTAEVWPALWRGCARPPATPEWQSLCATVRQRGISWGQDVGHALVRQWLEASFQPWQVFTAEGQATGLLTGYFEPLIDARRKPAGAFQTPLHRPPADLGQRKPHLTRAALETTDEGKAALAGRELLYVADPLDALLVQVQGSTRVRVLDEPNGQGQPRVVRLAFAGHNDQPYQSVARWLVDQGAFPLEQASWGAIKTWAAQNPGRVAEMLRANPRVVFFREEPLTQPELGPLGAQAQPLTPGRSIAVDKDTMPYGTLVWVDSTEPQAWAPNPPAPRPLQRLVVAQDTGGAIIGAVRADYFWGWGDEALLQAGRTKQSLKMWVLWPK